MENKFVRAILFDRQVRARGVKLIVGLAGLFILANIVGGQSRTLRQVKTNRALVQKIPSLEKAVRDHTIVTQDLTTIGKVQLILQGATIQEGAPYALIDGVVYGEGDTIGNDLIEKIIMEPGGGGQVTLKNKETQEIKMLYVPQMR